MESTSFQQTIEWDGLVRPALQRFSALCYLARRLVDSKAEEWFTLGNEQASATDSTYEGAHLAIAEAREVPSWYEASFVVAGGTAPLQAIVRTRTDGSQSLTLHMYSRERLEAGLAAAAEMFGDYQ